jgi:glycosyltransferase involved in cell wall biosynthesis
LNYAISHEEMPHLFAAYDLLFLPLGFCEKDILFAKYSMPTKISEYMISGTPILAYASEKTALHKYVQSGQFAYLLSERSIDKLFFAVKELHTRKDLRESYGKRAKKEAIRSHNADTVRENFREALNAAIEKRDLNI